MSIQTATILSALYSCKRVFMRFGSVTSEGKMHEGHYTLKKQLIERQSNSSDTLVVWDVDNNCWQDIRVSSINWWAGIPDE